LSARGDRWRVDEDFGGIGAQEADDGERPQLAEKRKLGRRSIAAIERGRPGTSRPRPRLSDFRLLGDLERVIDLDAGVPHRRLQLGVSKEQLNGRRFFVRR
jgi:hypothetical protein